MRLLLTGFVAASLLSGQARAVECLRTPDMVAMDVIALKTQLMVTALTCHEDERYNSFVRKYQPDLQREDKSLTAFFTRAFGRSAQKQRDDYITQLANSRSQDGLRQGSLFCDRNLGTFDEVMSLRNNGELVDYAAGRGGAQPISATTCGGAPAAVARAAVRRK